MKLSKEQFFRSSQEAGMQEQQIHILWEKMSIHNSERKFNLFNVLCYIGAWFLIFSVSWFCCWNPAKISHSTLLVGSCTYMLVFTSLGIYFWHFKKLPLLGGLFTVIAVSTVPLIVYLIQNIAGWWPEHRVISYRDFYHKIESGWILMEVATLAACSVALYFVRFPFLSAVLYFTIKFFVFDLNDYFSEGDFDLTAKIFAVSGIVLAIYGFFLDRKEKTDFAFWAYYSGLIAFFPSLIFLAESELAHLGYGLISFILVVFSVIMKRKVIFVLSALGISTYIGHLAYEFADSLLFTFLLGLVGFSILIFAFFFQRFQQRIHHFLLAALPPSLKKRLTLQLPENL